MLQTILRSFARAYGRSLGYSAARRTSWLALPVLVLVLVVGLVEFATGGQLSRLAGPLLELLR